MFPHQCGNTLMAPRLTGATEGPDLRAAGDSAAKMSAQKGSSDMQRSGSRKIREGKDHGNPGCAINNLGNSRTE